VLHLLALIVLGALIWVTIFSLPLFLVGGLRWDDLRSLLLHYAYKSFTFEGDVIPGVRPFVGTRLVIRVLSREDDARRALVTKAITIAEQRRGPRNGKLRLLLRTGTRVGQASAMSVALREARWFTSPVLGARLRVRCASDALGRAW
jgi:hypothetical protein